MEYNTLLDKLENQLKSLQRKGINYLNVDSLKNDELSGIIIGLDKMVPKLSEIKKNNLSSIQNIFKKQDSERFKDLKNNEINKKFFSKFTNNKIILDQENRLLNLYKKYKTCLNCQLGKTRNCIVFGKGSSESLVMFIGEGPGAEEDKIGEPFVGRAGKLLTKMINSIGIDREDFFITNIVKCRPPQNRNPTELEIKSCFPIIEKQIEIINPKLIVTLGNFPAKTLIPNIPGITKVHGKIFQYKDWKVLPTFHPSYLLRNRSSMTLAWDDFKIIPELAF